MGSNLDRVIRRAVHTIPEAIHALDGMHRQLTAAKTFTEIKKIEQYTEALKVLFAHVDEVKHKAQDVIISANVRIGEELKKVPKRGGPGRGRKTTDEPVNSFLKGKRDTGLTDKQRSRLSKLAAIPEPRLEQLKEKLRAQDKDVTVNSILTEVGQEKAANIRAARRQVLAEAPILEDGYEYRIGRAQDMLGDIKEKRPPLILTDPAYEKAADPLFDWLFRFANDVLPPGAR
jgi:hypothetical protein